MGKNKYLFSRLILSCLILTLIIAGVVFYLRQNQTNASTNINSNSAQSETTPKIDANLDADKIAITNVPILMYHYIRDYKDQSDLIGIDLSVSPQIFDQQMTYLTQNNYQTITPSQMIDGFSGNFKIQNSKKPIIITFDDGYDDAYTNAFPILLKHNFNAVFYIISGQIGQNERMNREQIIDLDKKGMIIGSHTVSHPSLTELSNDILVQQLSNSKSNLEQLISHQIVDFCYPAGKYNDNVVSFLKTVGYKTAVTTESDVANLNSDNYKLPRIRVKSSTNFANILK